MRKENTRKTQGQKITAESGFVVLPVIIAVVVIVTVIGGGTVAYQMQKRGQNEVVEDLVQITEDQEYQEVLEETEEEALIVDEPEEDLEPATTTPVVRTPVANTQGEVAGIVASTPTPTPTPTARPTMMPMPTWDPSGVTEPTPRPTYTPSAELIQKEKDLLKREQEMLERHQEEQRLFQEKYAEEAAQSRAKKIAACKRREESRHVEALEAAQASFSGRGIGQSGFRDKAIDDLFEEYQYRLSLCEQI